MIANRPDFLSGKVALITGGGAGIGKASAKLLAAAGARVAVLGRTANELKATCSEIERDGGKALPLLGDVAKPAHMIRAYARLLRIWKRLDIVLANAGINGVWTSLEDLRPEEWDQTLAVNLRGTFLTVKYAVLR